ncbi:MAG: hypothetical protein E7406_08015 [Ruminococcaceae bacterium]|nr:hypothetical protein [Oscillospiraceae bacterium]
MDSFKEQALKEYSSDTKTVRRCKDGKPFWNTYSTQFMYAPEFFFPKIPGTKECIFVVTDSMGREHTFTEDSSVAPLTPIWNDISPGIAELKVYAVHGANGEKYLAGARSFCKMDPFPGRESLPERACSYKDCAAKAFDYVFNDDTTQYWLTHGLPKPDYYHNVYPSKMISSLVKAMLSYGELVPEKHEEALKIATNAADYLLSITYGEDSALAGLPPTYSFKGLDKEIVDKNAPAADRRKHLLMSIYPASAGSAYLLLEKATGDKKYLNAATKIAEYYKNNVLESGSWYLLINEKDGKPESPNHCAEFSILEFLNSYYKRTGDECWHILERNYFSHLGKTYFENYNWEGQFEDSTLSTNYNNLTHLNADKMIRYITENFSDDAEMIEFAEELMRFVEDQFVVWGDFAPWNQFLNPAEKWYSPAVLEQYYWYVPIDGSTAMVALAFLNMYEVTKDELYLEKALALGDSITRMQNPESGVIPTHWMTTDCSTVLKNFWMNCHIGSAYAMKELAKATGEI